MSKIDYKRELKHLYRPSAKEFELVDVPPMNFLMIDGHGDPNTAQEYQDALEALYAVAYRLKFTSKSEKGKEYVVPPMEGLWWAENMEEFSTGDKSTWDWTMMIMQPEWITQEMFEEACREVLKKKGLEAVGQLRFETYREGSVAQVMHIGPYAEEAPTIAKLHQFIQDEGRLPEGRHHEIYLGDPKRTAPERLKTIIRQPVGPGD